MGAKALHVEGVPRDMQSVDGKLNQISGEGRVVLTASGPTERAWESARLGHGFLTGPGLAGFSDSNSSMRQIMELNPARYPKTALSLEFFSPQIIYSG